jgi:YD repeat-containing protein
MINRIWRIGLLVLLAFAAAAHAGQEHYDYDALGRLIRFINPAGEVTEYDYDAVGNILEVRRAAAIPPQITGVAPDSVRRGKTTAIVVTGADLLGATVIAAGDGLHITDLRSTATEITFLLTVDDGVTLGPQPFTLSSSTGSAGFSLDVRPVLPSVIASPATLILSPGGQSVELKVTLSSPDIQDHRLALTITDPAVASISAATLNFPAGQTQASLTVTSGALGNTVLDLASATLKPVKVGIYVTKGEGSGDDYPGERLRFSAQVGVTRQPQMLTQPIGPFISPAVGVTRQPQMLTQPIGPFISPAVGVDKGLE